jgi:hypothetical protein
VFGYFRSLSKPLELGAACALAFAIAQPAFAQSNDLGPFLNSPIPFDSDRGRNIGVVERARPELDPVGIRVGGLTAFPSVTAALGVSNNVFANTTNKRTDAFFAFDPRVKLTTNWSNNKIAIEGGADLIRFANTPIKNQTGFDASASGEYELWRDTQVVGFAQVRRGYEAQFSSAAPNNALRSVEYTQISGLVRGTHQFGRFKATAAVDVNRLNFGDLPIPSRNIVIDQDFRDVAVVRFAARLAYAISPDTAVFAEGNYSSIEYDQARYGANIRNRTGAQAVVLGGVSLDVTALVRAQIGLGYTRRVFDARGTYRPIEGLAYDGRLTYFLTELTNVSVGATRSIEESVTNGSSGFFSNTYRVRVDHELLRNLLLYGQAEYQRNRFEGVSRRDTVFVGRFGGTYLGIGRINLSAGVSYIDRGSSGQLNGQKFKEWRGVVAVGWRL